ncbi:UDP-glucose 4-epimerase [Hartmannibacter diazotrophicus]|uniref:UDP-glucose 4-epimerase n=1 Tax=Hartmannibacter diazotrophicus TaxID=1482074 RepID=A0A2C9D3Q0_9HYPH|nr:UDP-glucose 4-epimerase GalE [Hartmannibacter diazotrophicus]SON54095.1 UDP-glucose 4-epimerase [Hartmannibacter diazotrophicus]
MTTLVTGGAGYIGSHMVHALVDRGEEVVVLDDLSTGFDAVLPENARLIVGDVGDAAFLDRIIAENDIDAIAHFAGSIIVPESVTNPLKYYSNNTVNSCTLIGAAVRGGVKSFLFSSTAAVYGEAGQDLINEDAPLAPMSPYGSSKLMTEVMLRDAAAAHGFKYGILRYFNVAGADPKGRTGQSTKDATHLIKIASQAAIGLRSGMSIFGTDFDTPDGTCVRDYVHVSDLIQAHVLALAHLQDGGDSFTANCAYGHGYSVREVVDAVKRVSGVDFPVELTGRRAGDPPSLVAESKRIRSLLGWQPQYQELDTIVSHALAWEDHLRKRNSKP